MKRLTVSILFLAAFLVIFPQLCSATPIYGNVVDHSTYNEHGLGRFTGESSYSYASGNASATLTVTVTNDENTSAGGVITGIAFYLPTGVSVSGMTSNVEGWGLISGNDAAVNPENEFFGGNIPTFGATHLDKQGKGSWGGGSPDGGIGVGAEGQFTFTLTGENLGGLTIESFVQQGNFMATRFQAFANEGSDKVAGVLGAGGAQVPEPATLILLGSGIVGAALVRKRNKKTKKA